jgi:hypothetical protein
MVVLSQHAHPRLLLVGLLSLIPAVPGLYSRVPSRAQNADRSNTSGPVVPTDVLVVDCQGNSVRGLAWDQFVLLVNGEPRPLTSFEEVSAGSLEEEAQWGRVRGMQSPAAAKGNLEGGRVIFFFLDDFHMSPGGLKRAREALSRYIDTVMGATFFPVRNRKTVKPISNIPGRPLRGFRTLRRLTSWGTRLQARSQKWPAS